MLKATSRRLITALAVGALTVSGAAGAWAAEVRPAGGQRAGDAPTADDGGGINPMCMLRPQDCMYPPDDHRKGDGHGQPGPDADGINPLCMLRPQDCMYPPDDHRKGDGGMNPLCMFRPQDCWPPPGHGPGDGDRRPSPGGGRTGG